MKIEGYSFEEPGAKSVFPASGEGYG